MIERLTKHREFMEREFGAMPLGQAEDKEWWIAMLYASEAVYVALALREEAEDKMVELEIAKELGN